MDMGEFWMKVLLALVSKLIVGGMILTILIVLRIIKDKREEQQFNRDWIAWTSEIDPRPLATHGLDRDRMFPLDTTDVGAGG